MFDRDGGAIGKVLLHDIAQQLRCAADLETNALTDNQVSLRSHGHMRGRPNFECASLLRAASTCQAG